MHLGVGSGPSSTVCMAMPVWKGSPWAIKMPVLEWVITKPFQLSDPVTSVPYFSDLCLFYCSKLKCF